MKESLKRLLVVITVVTLAIFGTACGKSDNGGEQDGGGGNLKAAMTLAQVAEALTAPNANFVITQVMEGEGRWNDYGDGDGVLVGRYNVNGPVSSVEGRADKSLDLAMLGLKPKQYSLLKDGCFYLWVDTNYEAGHDLIFDNTFAYGENNGWIAANIIKETDATNDVVPFGVAVAFASIFANPDLYLNKNDSGDYSIRKDGLENLGLIRGFDAENFDSSIKTTESGVTISMEYDAVTDYDDMGNPIVNHVITTLSIEFGASTLTLPDDLPKFE